MSYYNIKNLFNRMESLSAIFWIAILFIFLGIFLPILGILIWIGGLVVLLYIIYFLVWLFQEMG